MFFNFFFYKDIYEFLFCLFGFFGSLIFLMYFYPLFTYIFKVNINTFPYIFLPILPVILLFIVSIILFLSLDIYGLSYYSIADDHYFITDFRAIRNAMYDTWNFWRVIYQDIEDCPIPNDQINCENNYIKYIICFCITLAGISLTYYKFC